jgi:predicted membrane-bound spermidine synthase
VLQPSPFPLSLFAPEGRFSLEAAAALKLDEFEWTDAAISASVSIGAIATFLSLPERTHRSRLVNRWFVANAIAVFLLFTIPVLGPASNVWPLPPASIGAESSLMVPPRLGLLCLPALSVFLLSSWSLRRDHDGKRVITPTTFLTLGLGLFVLLLELIAKRYSLASIATTAAVALVVETTAWLLARESTAVITVAPSLEPVVTTSTVDLAVKRTRALLTAVFFLSGMAALVYQVVFAKGLALTFGSTSHASTIVLATYMGGLALGSWLGGRLAEKLSRPVLGYASAELGIAVLCAASPFTLKLARLFYVRIAEGANPSESWLVGLQLALGALVLVPPTLLMGLTMPLLTKQFLDERSTLGSSAGLLYTANTLGAAVGASVTGYAVLPWLGISRSLYAAVTTNVLVSVFALLATRTNSVAPANEPSNEVVAAPLKTKVKNSFTPIVERQYRLLGLIATVQLTVGGFVTFGLETSFVHLLATVAGTSAYAFSLMLFAFLIGLSLGSTFGRKWLPSAARLPVALLLCQFALAVTILLGSAYWDMLPGYFASFGRWPFTLTFASREFVRFVVCLVVMVPPAFCIGVQFPIAMEAVGLGWPRQRLLALGRASALNTVGNILGAIIVGFLLLPRFGSHRTLAILTLLCLLLAALALVVAEKRERTYFGALVASGVVGLLVLPPNFDLTRLSSGGNVYFKPQYYGQVIDATESLDGGLTTVALSQDGHGNPIKTLLTNGKFQGNDRRDFSGEMVAQTSFAVAPLLHTEARNRALVIGFGTGTTTRVLDEAGFAHVDVAELSGDIVTLADRHFSTINNGVIHRPNVQVHVTDGRNFLLLDRHQYDLISIELSSIWFAGAANLYNDEFYALVEPRLSAQGILQQWIQLHRLSHRDIMSILTTLERRFPKSWIYFLGKQGIVVACKHDCAPNPKAIARLLEEERLKTTLSVFPNGLRSVLYGRLLTPDGLKAILLDYQRENGLTEEALLSTDDNLYLEYSTPRGNVREYDDSIYDNELFLARKRPLSPYEATQLSLDDVPAGGQELGQRE